jgi:hypothetical protein
VLDGELPGGHLIPALGWLLGLLLVAFAAYGRSTSDDWGTQLGGDG